MGNSIKTMITKTIFSQKPRSLILSNIHNFLGIHITQKMENLKIQSLLDKIQPMSTQKQLIRLGPMGDGGYLVPDDLIGIEACFSPGVSTVSGFEKDCADRGMKIFLADKSVKKPPENHQLFNFTQKYIGVTNDDNFMTIDDWVANSLTESESDLLLQMDIEGFEYEVLLGMSNQLMNRFRIMVIEFHYLDELWNRPFFQLISRVFDKILQTHTCVHNHPNNYCYNYNSVKIGEIEIPRLTEMTFLRNDRIDYSSPVQIFPHALDCDNTDYSTLPLPKCWYRQTNN